MVKIITDTTACLPVTIRDQYHIPVVPQMIHFGETLYTEGIDIDINLFLDLLISEKDLPKTSAPPPELFSQLFTQFSTSHETIICIHPSADLSGTIRSAETARLDFPDQDIRIIDSRLVASPLGVVVHRAAIWAAQDLSPDLICQEVINLCHRSKVFFLVATLDYLARGGRIGGASALVGNALQLKPILTISKGKVEQYSKVRTFNKALSHIKEIILQDYPPKENGHLTIMHADSPDQALELAIFFERSLSIPRPLISNLPPAIIAHVGPGSIAVGYFEDPELAAI